MLKLEHVEGDKYDDLKPGNEFTVVTLAVKNTSDRIQSLDSYCFKMVQSNGDIKSDTLDPSFDDTRIKACAIAPGGGIEGTISYVTPKKDKKLTLVFDDVSHVEIPVEFDVFNSVDSFQPMQGNTITLDNNNPIIGDTVIAENLSIRVDSVAVIDGNEDDIPQPGNQFMLVYLTLENVGSGEQDYSSYEFTLQNSTGEIRPPEYTYLNEETDLSDGTLSSGNKITGSIVYEAPIGDTELCLIYTNIGQKAIINLK